MSRTAVVAGVGPGLGESLVRKFAAEGCRVGFLARTESYLADLEAELEAEGHDVLGVACDVGDPVEIAEAFSAVREAFGTVDVLVNHASGGGFAGLFDLERSEFRRAWETGALGGFCCTRAVAPEMVEAGGGTVIFTGATSSIRGREGAVGFSSAKFAVRGLAQSLARELGPEGVRVAHVVIDGQIRPPEGVDGDADAYLDPDRIAETYWHLAETEATDTMPFEVHVTNGTQPIEFV